MHEWIKLDHLLREIIGGINRNGNNEKESFTEESKGNKKTSCRILSMSTCCGGGSMSFQKDILPPFFFPFRCVQEAFKELNFKSNV